MALEQAHTRLARARAALREVRGDRQPQGEVSASGNYGRVAAIQTVPGVDHAFFNDTGARYDPTQAAAAYQATIDWFDRHLA